MQPCVVSGSNHQNVAAAPTHVGQSFAGFNSLHALGQDLDISLATGYVGYTGTHIYPRGNKKKRCDLLGASNVGDVREKFAVCTRILYPVTNSVPERLERPQGLGRSKQRYVGTLFVPGKIQHNGTFRTLSEHVGNNTVYPGTKSGNTCSHVPICYRHTMVLRLHPQPEPSRAGSNIGR